MRTAIVHDYFTRCGNAERVAAHLYQMIPAASVFTAVASPEGVPLTLRHVDLHPSWLQCLPSIHGHDSLCSLLYPFGLGLIDLSPFDLIIANSSSYARGIKAGGDTVHVCYCHAPLWGPANDERLSGVCWPPRHLAKRALLATIRRWEKSASRQPDHFIASSNVIAEHIRRCCARTAEVIYPPVQENRFVPLATPENYYLLVSDLVKYKHIDRVVQACTNLRKALVVIGDGPDRARLAAMGGPAIHFIRQVTEQELQRHLSQCRALIVPDAEVCSMLPLEVAAAGRPTIAYHAGSALETILENRTGIFFGEQRSELIENAIQRFEHQDWSPERIRVHAKKFSVEVFQDRFRSFLQRVGVPLPRITLKSSVAHRSFACSA